MMNECFNQVNSDIKKGITDDEIKNIFKNINKTFKSVFDTLEKEGVVFVQRDAFETVVKNNPNPNLKTIFDHCCPVKILRT